MAPLQKGAVFFTQSISLPASRFIRSVRLARVQELLVTTDLNISEIAYEVGFRDPNYFTRTFTEEVGHAPIETRK